MSSVSRGRPEKFLTFEDIGINVNEIAFRRIFEHRDVKSRKIVVISVVGAFRKGKSFFLDYCLRFLYANYKSINYLENPLKKPYEWMGNKNDPLEGFSWRPGTDRDTMGVVIWNDAFLYTDNKTGGEFAIIVMDTQGLFDNETTVENNKRIFALSTLISSIQVLNLSQIIQEDQLQYLQFATEFAKFTLSDSHHDANKPFQNLVFLVRDWDNTVDFPLGSGGGNNYLDKVLKIKESKDAELKFVRDFIHSSFENLSCFLIPYPGKIVTGVKKVNDERYNGNWRDMDEDFKEEFFKLIECLLRPENLRAKKVNDIDLDGQNYLDFLLQYFKLFQTENFPKTQSLYELTVTHQLNLVLGSCVEKYRKSLQSTSINTVQEMLLLHDASKNDAFLMYKESKKMGNPDHEAFYRKCLEDEIDKIYNEWKEQTESNIRKVDEEQMKTRLAEQEKQKLSIEKIKLEREAIMHKMESQEMKHNYELEKLKITRTMEMDKLKFEMENHRQADERQHEIEKLRLEKEIECEKICKENEIAKHQLQNELNVKSAEQAIMLEKIKADNKHKAEELEIKARNFELEKLLDQEKIKSQMDAAEIVRKTEKEQLAREMKMELEKIKIMSENQIALAEKDKEVLQAEYKANEQILAERNSSLQQQHHDMTQKIQSAEERLAKEKEINDANLIDKGFDLATTIVTCISPVAGIVAKAMARQKK